MTSSLDDGIANLDNDIDIEEKKKLNLTIVNPLFKNNIIYIDGKYKKIIDVDTNHNSSDWSRDSSVNCLISNDNTKEIFTPQISIIDNNIIVGVNNAIFKRICGLSM